MKSRILWTIAIVIATISYSDPYAQKTDISASALISASVSRNWIPHNSSLGFSIELPDFFKESGNPPNSTQLQQYYDSLPGSGITNIMVIGEKVTTNNTFKALKKYYLEQKKGDPTSVFDSGSIEKSYFDEWSKDGPDLESACYTRGILAVNGVYRISLCFDPQYKNQMKAIIPRIVNSFRLNEGRN